MLLDGINHIAILTSDTGRLQAFYQEVFDATVSQDFEPEPGMRLSFIDLGPHTQFNVFQFDKDQPVSRSDMFARGFIDHFGLQAESLEAFETIRERLIERGAADEFVTDFGDVYSIFFRDPDGLELEVCVPSPDALPGVVNPPGTPAARYVT